MVNWTVEGIARARFWYSRVLTELGKDEMAAKLLADANKVKDRYLEEYSEFLKEEEGDEAAVYDQMVPIWILQTSGPLQNGGRGTLKL